MGIVRYQITHRKEEAGDFVPSKDGGTKRVRGTIDTAERNGQEKGDEQDWLRNERGQGKKIYGKFKI